MWKNIRIAILLLILLVVIINNWRDQNQNWNRPIVVLLHPVNADGHASTSRYIQQLQLSQFVEVKSYLEQQSANYRQPISVIMKMGRTLTDQPPKVPNDASILNVMWWSLKFRFYAWRQRKSADQPTSVTLYLNYYDPQHVNELRHSTALEKGRIGTVNLFASNKQNSQNNIVLTHELLHAFGATDKYNLQTGQPLFPIGYAKPEQQPLYPQKQAELMAGRLPVSDQQNRMPESLKQTIINALTAQEVGWTK
ncbi:hypothetical protein [Acinetobacter guerrae]|uniref:hypothetical protein n=1 Tax=Acinetobacter guerrae TaxID=1843371 RepID=UPI00128B9F8B|nr:hypothetical protein [Acinetobacter guerrae]MPW43480.1 hypothetical protein [Acinetobacter guerrae]